MAYGNPDSGGNPGNDMGGETHDESMHEGMEEKKYPSLFLSSDMLPEGMKANPGDILEFRVIGMDKDGDTEVVYNTGKDENGSEDEWGNELKHEMSARNNDEEGGSY